MNWNGYSVNQTPAATSQSFAIEEIGQKEGELIRQYRPALNTQIPRAENWRTWEVKKVDVEEAMSLLINE